MAGAQVIRISGLTPLADSLESATEGFLNYCRSRNLSENTVSYYRYRLESFGRYLEGNAPGTAPKDMTPQLIRAFLAKESSPATANHSVITMRAFFNFLVNDGFLSESPMHGVDKLKRKTTVIDTFTFEQVEAVLRTCGKDFVGMRDRAAILVLLDCGLRVSELCGLTLDDISWNEQTMMVLGKGDKERVVPFGQNTRQALTQYLARRPELGTRAFFVTCYVQPLDRYRMREVIQGRCSTAGITGLRCSPHTFRHTFAVQYLRNGGDVFSLQKMLGHSDLTMTRRYAELSQTDVQEKHRLYSPADRLQTAGTTKGRKRIR